MQDPRQHLMKIIGTLTVENIEFSTALVNRNAEIAELKMQIEELQKQVPASTENPEED